MKEKNSTNQGEEFYNTSGEVILHSNTQPGVKEKDLHSAIVHFLDGTKSTYFLHKNSEGIVLLDLVSKSLNLIERDYFALSYLDNGIKYWIYNDKKISKKVKGEWEFKFEVKFFPPDPDMLNDDVARYLLFLQIREDVYKGSIPLSMPFAASLAGFVMQSLHGDFVDSPNYGEKIDKALILPNTITSEFVDKVKEAHQQQKGLTPSDMERCYLELAKQLSLYGVVMFPLKELKDKPTHVGVSASSVNIYRNQVREHRFIWQDIIKVAYRRNNFEVKVKPGVLKEKKEALWHGKTDDYKSAKRIWKCCVEYHTFFRLIQAEDDKKGFFKFGSKRFSYKGRTQFQSKINASIHNNGDEVQSKDSQHLNDASTLSEVNTSEFINSPGKSYTISETTPKKKTRKSSTSTSSSDSDDAVIVDKRHINSPSKIPNNISCYEEKEYPLEKKNDLPFIPVEKVNDSLNDERTTKHSSNCNNTIPVVEITENQSTNKFVPTTHVSTWKEVEDGPETVTEDYDEDGNKIMTITKRQHVKTVVQKEIYKTVEVPLNQLDEYIEQQHKENVENIDNEILSNQSYTVGNCTVDTIKYKGNRDGVYGTHTLHKIFYKNDSTIDHDDLLDSAILQTTEKRK
ncbi:FERM domain and Pleckstrin homology-like domain and FERM/acyl-CoA-binding protein, 3-helical bundle domain and FERM, N-terminal domain and FERM, C-terminal PH-like domain and FERM central domain and Band 4.1 domain and Band 4.1 family-containing protein [Strongyloides ratti]|uniref:FERM domain-containing protein n=1 Tax=Strongyloides ratti TaxID=34506 RepID=A0A090L8Y2_STRRB|nr:FERM domain and Pleckstrin homology-like domain and FERM/acyl-CoA-binding protein, 3-helical bundle domain and FERM, N-terminal domain and FERM, C-terminal PH-like domain and FERM central domain and Band 4.1 domain and Band 4.1 family-containing protein [Strongyloides ratti]CEF64608.1 FERM domain and Pleckstrin homology-like domain and FERM/acyl-CoA-binding protein, 3-helical bundle domain and FERM, N-terminal domain and FERM, C-terminal PH-like domain and FERM central domain and Band 4.1 domai